MWELVFSLSMVRLRSLVFYMYEELLSTRSFLNTTPPRLLLLQQIPAGRIYPCPSFFKSRSTPFSSGPLRLASPFRCSLLHYNRSAPFASPPLRSFSGLTRRAPFSDPTCRPFSKRGDLLSFFPLQNAESYLPSFRAKGPVLYNFDALPFRSLSSPLLFENLLSLSTTFFIFSGKTGPRLLIVEARFLLVQIIWLSNFFNILCQLLPTKRVPIQRSWPQFVRSRAFSFSQVIGNSRVLSCPWHLLIRKILLFAITFLRDCRPSLW